MRTPSDHSSFRVSLSQRRVRTFSVCFMSWQLVQVLSASTLAGEELLVRFVAVEQVPFRVALHAELGDFRRGENHVGRNQAVFILAVFVGPAVARLTANPLGLMGLHQLLFLVVRVAHVAERIVGRFPRIDLLPLVDVLPPLIEGRLIGVRVRSSPARPTSQAPAALGGGGAQGADRRSGAPA